MSALWLWLVLGACDRPTAEHRELSGALDAWRQGAERLEQGDHAGAREAFRKGLAQREDDTLLLAWDARAAAVGGDLDGAIRQSRRVLKGDPDFAQVRYNLAAYLARTGALDEAGAELRVALELGARPSRDVLQDPDFQPHLRHPAFAFLPVAGLVVAVEHPSGPVFWGSQAIITLRISGVGGHPVMVDAPTATGPIELVGVVEDRIRSTDGYAVDLRWRFKVLGAGWVDLGPFEVSAGPYSASAKGVRIEATAPEGREAPPEGRVALRFETPTALGADFADGSVHRTPDGIVVRGLLTDTVEMGAPSASRVRYEVRAGGQPLWQLTRYRGFEEIPERVVITRGGVTVFDGAPLP